ncbi:murein L,D-transpeptidase YcbB/YkuD [Mesorhizobium sp. J18]|nr:murein L,D-transpeptidase YcbB/YkuD [Mesorhizobium sp. J18]
MKTGRMNRLAISLIALTAAFAGTVTDASAQNLLERIFGGNRANRPMVEHGAPYQQMRRQQHLPRQHEQAPQQPVRPKAMPTVSAPSYYDYKPQALVRVDFGTLAQGASAIPLEAAVADPVFRDAIREIGDFDLYAEKEIAEAIAQHYTSKPAFIWISGYQTNERAEQALRVLGDAGSYGLSEADYAVSIAPANFSNQRAPARLKNLVRLEMTLSARVLRYARDAYSGRVDPNKLSGYHDFPPKPFDLAKALDAISTTRDLRAYLESRHPQNDEYRALRVELEALRASAEDEIVVDPKMFVRPGGMNIELPKILQIIQRDADPEFLAEYGMVLTKYAESDRYADELVPVIKAVQKAKDLNPDGVIGPRTVQELVGDTKTAKIDKVLLALERLRWHPSNLGDTRVFLNTAAFTASFIENGREKLSMRTVVGKATNQTSFFYDEIEYVEFNPYWGVPRSIIVNEMLPRLLRDPGYLDRAGYEVMDSKGRRISSASINWARYGANIPYSVRQVPSEANALGELKIMFPNKHAIYMHDTPAKDLFQRDTRAFSHGCVRLQDPRGMASAVLGVDRKQIEERLKRGHNRQNAPRKIPVYVGYFTAWPGGNGAVSYAGDIYERDVRLKAALEKVADIRAPSS